MMVLYVFSYMGRSDPKCITGEIAVGPVGPAHAAADRAAPTLRRGRRRGSVGLGFGGLDGLGG
jgi:hypothetical protein